MRAAILLLVFAAAPVAASHAGTTLTATGDATAVVGTENCRVCPCGTYNTGGSPISAGPFCVAQTIPASCDGKKIDYDSATVITATATCTATDAACAAGQIRDTANPCQCIATSAPTATPTADPTADPTTAAATGTPTAEPTADPTAATPTPTATPTADPTADPTAATGTPTAEPTADPTAATPTPTATPTADPTADPTLPPTLAPTLAPTSAYCAPGTEPFWHATKRLEVKAAMTVSITKAAYDANKATYDAAFKATIVAEVCGTKCTAADVVITVAPGGRRRRLAANDKIKVDYTIKGLEPSEVQAVSTAVTAISTGTSSFTTTLVAKFEEVKPTGVASISEPTIDSVVAPKVEEEVATVPTPAPTPDGVSAGTSASLSAFVAFIPILYALSSTSVQ